MAVCPMDFHGHASFRPFAKEDFGDLFGVTHRKIKKAWQRVCHLVVRGTTLLSLEAAKMVLRFVQEETVYLIYLRKRSYSAIDPEKRRAV